MADRRFGSPRAALSLSLLAMRAALGGIADPALALLVVIVIASITLASEAVSTLVFTGNNPFLGFLPLLLLFLLLAFLHRINPHLEPKITQHSIRPARALIWFLSPPGKDKTGEETDPKLMLSWRMAHEAISAQIAEGSLDKVLVIASSDASGERKDGSFRHFEKFQSSLSVSTGMDKGKIVMAAGYPGGVDFEEAEKLYRAMEDIYADLEKEGYENRDVIVDITGGQKMPSILGGVATLVEGRRLQYVSTRDYKIHEYDITYN